MIEDLIENQPVLATEPNEQVDSIAQASEKYRKNKRLKHANTMAVQDVQTLLTSELELDPLPLIENNSRDMDEAGQSEDNDTIHPMDSSHLAVPVEKKATASRRHSPRSSLKKAQTSEEGLSMFRLSDSYRARNSSTRNHNQRTLINTRDSDGRALWDREMSFKSASSSVLARRYHEEE